MKVTMKRKTLVASFMLILISIVSFTITTFAWFSDSVSSLNNIITTGNLDAEMYWTNDLNSGEWYNIEDAAHNAVFTYDNYEPGYTDIKYLKIVNNGSLAYKYDLSLLALGEVGELAEVVDLYYLANVTSNISSRNLPGMENRGTLNNVLGSSLSGTEVLLAKGQGDGIHNSHEAVVAIALQMQTTAGNEYQGKSIGDGFSIRLTATQYSFEEDSFGSDYDKDATFPVSIIKQVSTTNGQVDTPATMSAGLVNAKIPTGVEVESDTLTLTVKEMEKTQSNVRVEGDETLTSLDVHIDGVSEDNTVPMIISINSVASKYLNSTSVQLYHVEGNQTIAMERVYTTADLVEHNQFYYNPSTGTFVVALASFSEVALLQNVVNAWEGGVDHSWYTADTTSLTIYNAEQLWSFSQIVGGMADSGLKDTEGNTIYLQDNFKGKTIKLASDIKLNGKAEEYVAGVTLEDKTPIFYPIGYYNNVKSYVKVSGGSVSSSFKRFMGTFDGNGHTISDFYQNTWEMFGDYNSGYSGTPNHYRDGMGLFGWVLEGTVKNLHVDKFSCDSEYGSAGVIATYANDATFENIAITNSNPGVYNNGNGGIVGYTGSGNAKGSRTDKESVLTFRNITIDNTNKITSLWGTWDGCCAGILGRYASECKVILDNCHVAAQMDVYNDVCGNYQYYWYRYSAMLIGSIEDMKTVNGYVVPNLDNFEVKSTTVHFGDWNNYYYCELVENSIASYTHDHQMSRLTVIESLSEIQENGQWTKTGNFMIKGTNGEQDTCYHIRKDAEGNFYQHTHESKGTEVIDGVEVLVEDKQCVYLPFNQIFQGYGWGVQYVGIVDEYKTDKMYISILDRQNAESVDKFEAKPITSELSFETDTEIAISDLFKAVSNPVTSIYPLSVQVSVTNYDKDGNPVASDFEFTRHASDWTLSTLKLSKGGTTQITIQDYVFCEPVSITIHVHEYVKSNHETETNQYIHKCKYCDAAYYTYKDLEDEYDKNIAEYNSAYAAYKQELAEYNAAYAEYQHLLDRYNSEKAIYEKDLAAWEKYYQDYAEYQSDLADSIQKWNTYYDDVKQYEENLPISQKLWEKYDSEYKEYELEYNKNAELWNSYNKYLADLADSTQKWKQYEAEYQKYTNDYNDSQKQWEEWDKEKAEYDKNIDIYNKDDTHKSERIYLKPNQDWLRDGARFAAYFFIDENTYQWMSMFKISDGYYWCDIPTKSNGYKADFTKVIFVRMNSNSNGVNNWDNKWNQTGDLTVAHSAKKYYEITGWDNSGQWVNDTLFMEKPTLSNHPTIARPEDLVEPIEPTVARPENVPVVGEPTVARPEDLVKPTKPTVARPEDLVKPTEPTVAKPDTFVEPTKPTKVAVPPSISVPTFDMTLPTDPVNEILAQYHVNFLAGSWNNWGNHTPLVYEKSVSGGKDFYSTGDIFSNTIYLEKGTYTFKFVLSGTWYGNGGTINETTLATAENGWEFWPAGHKGYQDEDLGPDCTIKVEKSGYYQFKINTGNPRPSDKDNLSHFVEVVYLG